MQIEWCCLPGASLSGTRMDKCNADKFNTEFTKTFKNGKNFLVSTQADFSSDKLVSTSLIQTPKLTSPAACFAVTSTIPFAIYVSWLTEI